MSSLILLTKILYFFFQIVLHNWSKLEFKISHFLFILLVSSLKRFDTFFQWLLLNFINLLTWNQRIFIFFNLSLKLSNLLFFQIQIRSHFVNLIIFQVNKVIEFLNLNQKWIWTISEGFITKFFYPWFELVHLTLQTVNNKILLQ